MKIPRVPGNYQVEASISVSRNLVALHFRVLKKKYLCTTSKTTKSMPITRKYKTKDGSIKQKTYTTVRGQRAESYRREQNRKYRTKIRQLQPPRQRIYPPSQADTLPSATVHQIIDEYKEGASLNKLSTKHGISRYILTKVIKKYNDAQ